MVDWQATVVKVVDDRTIWVHTYNPPVASSPPYPGFRAVEEWLIQHYPRSTTEIVYFENVPDSGPVLKVTFEDSKDLFLFMLEKA